MKYKLLPLFAAVLLLTACNGDEADLEFQLEVENKTDQAEEVTSDDEVEDQTVVEVVEPVLKTDLSPYFENADVTFYEALVPLPNDMFDQSYWDGIEGYARNFIWYESGVINVEPYDDWKMLLLQVECEGPCFSSDFYRFAYDEATEELIHLSYHSYSSLDIAKEVVEPFLAIEDSEARLSGLELPLAVQIPDTDYSLTLQNRFAGIGVDTDGNYFDDAQILFEDEALGTFYSFGGGCLHYKHPDGTIATYSFDDIFSEQATTIEGDIIDLNRDYSLTHNGCGVSTICYSTYDMDISELEAIGETESGISLYTVKNPIELSDEDADELSVSANSFANAQYDAYKEMEEYNQSVLAEVDEEGEPVEEEDEIMTYQAFLDTNAVIFWQDPFGRTSAFLHNDYQIPAECGKPVIYLYPEESQMVDVFVDIREFTKTIPEHGEDGWTVLAHPDGMLENQADGMEYPYLFWEGHSDVEVPMSRGFTVPRAELETFLNDSLTQLGLNEMEQADFMEFWLPEMLKNREPYFVISFLGTEAFNPVAPLTIDPKPDTLARIFMYYEPTFSNATYPEQELTGFERNGFTVVEWGGTSPHFQAQR